MMCVYGIELDGVSVYIGSTINMEKRKAYHLHALKRGRHSNAALQARYDSASECVIECRQEYFSVDELDAAETEHIDMFGIDSLCNRTKNTTRWKDKQKKEKRYSCSAYIEEKAQLVAKHKELLNTELATLRNKYEEIRKNQNRQKYLHRMTLPEYLKKCSKPVCSIASDGEITIYDSINQTEKAGFSPYKVTLVIKGERNFHRNLKWAFWDKKRGTIQS